VNLVIRVLLDLLVLSVNLVHEAQRVLMGRKVLLEALVLKVELAPRENLVRPAQPAFLEYQALLDLKEKSVQEAKTELQVHKVLLVLEVLPAIKENRVKLVLLDSLEIKVIKDKWVLLEQTVPKVSLVKKVSVVLPVSREIEVILAELVFLAIVVSPAFKDAKAKKAKKDQKVILDLKVNRVFLARPDDLVMLVHPVSKELKVFLARTVSTELAVILVSTEHLVFLVFQDLLDRRASLDQKETKVMPVLLVLLVLLVLKVLRATAVLKVTWDLLVNLVSLVHAVTLVMLVLPVSWATPVLKVFSDLKVLKVQLVQKVTPVNLVLLVLPVHQVRQSWLPRQTT